MRTRRHFSQRVYPTYLLAMLLRTHVHVKQRGQLRSKTVHSSCEHNATPRHATRRSGFKFANIIFAWQETRAHKDTQYTDVVRRRRRRRWRRSGVGGDGWRVARAHRNNQPCTVNSEIAVSALFRELEAGVECGDAVSGGAPSAAAAPAPAPCACVCQSVPTYTPTHSYMRAR